MTGNLNLSIFTQLDFLKYFTAAAEKGGGVVAAIITKDELKVELLSDGRDTLFLELMKDQRDCLANTTVSCPIKSDGNKTFKTYGEFLAAWDEPPPEFTEKVVMITEVIEPPYAVEKVKPGTTGVFKIYDEDNGVFKGTFLPDEKIGFADRYRMKAKLEVLETAEPRLTCAACGKVTDSIQPFCDECKQNPEVIEGFEELNGQAPTS